MPVSMIIPRVLFVGSAFLFCAQGLAFDTADNLPPGLRSSSHYCEGCQDDVIAMAAARMHSVDVDYRLAQLRGRARRRT